MLTERELLEFIAAGRAGARLRAGEVGIGDDCAVLRTGGRPLLLTIDVMVERVHFELAYTPPYLLGRKAVAASLSDIAAMGGRPRAILASVALPRKRPRSFARRLLEGIHDEALAADVSVLGGDTSASPGPVVVDVASIGETGPGGPLLRSGARAGDAIYVSGPLGGSAWGRKVLEAGFRPWSWRLWSRTLQGSVQESRSGRDKLVAALAHLVPRPRLTLGRLLADRRIASALIDISDGLSTDLHNLCEASRVGARIEQRGLPLYPGLETMGARGLKMALSGGEDYELLFTVPPRCETRLLRSARQLARPIARIGSITPARAGILLVDRRGRARPLPRTGYEHFRSR